MKKGVILLLGLLAVLGIVQAVSAAVAYEVVSIEITPTTGDLTPGEHVTIRCVVSMTGSGDLTFPTDNYLEAYTELDNIKWIYSVQIEGHGEDIDGMGRRYLNIDGWTLSYPEDTAIDVEYLLEGDAPAVSETSTIAIFRLQQIDDEGDVVSNSKYLKERTVVNPEAIDEIIEIREDELAELRTQIDSRYAEGVNTASAEEKYRAADDAITKAKTSSYANAQSYLTSALTYMNEAEALLEEAWAQKAIDDAQLKVEEVDEYLTYFKDNRSMATDSRVLSISTQLDNANTLLTLAKDKQASKEYNNARIQAEGALEKANDAYDSSVALREEIGEGFSFSLDGLGIYLIAAIVLIVVGVAGYTVYKRYYRWDELG
jgi:hypothetical protein